MKVNKLKNIINFTKNLNILYVEDNIDIQKQTLKMLSSFFNTIDVANNGKVASELFFLNHYDLIITDIKMPLIDGITFIETIRKDNKKIPILVFSAHDDKEYFLKTINLGIDGYILKPYTIEQIITTLENLVLKYDLKAQNIVKLANSFIWNTDTNQLSKNEEIIKLSRYERKLFELFISTNSVSKTYYEIEYYLFNDCEDNTKKLRNLLTRLKLKLNYDLFETLYSYGFSLKYEDIQ